MAQFIVKRLGIEDARIVLDASAVFDHALDEAQTTAFLRDDRHHLLLAFSGETVIGMLTAVELLHPDKAQPEMFIYELGVLEEWQRRGVATALLQELHRICQERRLGEMFVLTDPANDAAQATYRRAGGTRQPDQAMFVWDWRR